MRIIGIIFLVIVVLALAYLAYGFIFKKAEDGTPCSSTGAAVNDGTIVDGNCVVAQGEPSHTNGSSIPNAGGFIQTSDININPPLSFVSHNVDKSIISPAADPGTFFNGANEYSAQSYNLFKSEKSNPLYIDYIISFNEQCSKYVWYNNWLYTLINTDIIGNSGDKRCYYKVDKSSLPVQLKLRNTIPPYTCLNYKYYLSGIEYRFKEANTEYGSINQSNHYCIFDRI